MEPIAKHLAPEEYVQGTEHPAEGHHAAEGGNPKFGRRMKNFAKALHLPVPGSGTHHEAEHHRVSVEHFLEERGGAAAKEGGVIYDPTAPDTPNREPTQAPAGSTIERAPPAATTAFGPPSAHPEPTPATFQTLDQDSSGKASPTIPTPFSSAEPGELSPQRLSGDTDELTAAKPAPSLDRATESQEVFVEDIAHLLPASAADRLREAQKAKNTRFEEAESHTDAGFAPGQSAFAAGTASAPAAAARILPPKEKEKEKFRLEEDLENLGFVESVIPDTMPPPLLGSNAEMLKEVFENFKPAEQGEEGTVGGQLLDESEAAAIEASPEPAEQKEILAPVAAEKKAEAGQEERQGKPSMTVPLESPSGKVFIPSVEVPETLAVPHGRQLSRSFFHMVFDWISFNPPLALLLIIGISGLLRAVWIMAPSTLQEFGPVLMVSGGVAVITSVLTFLVRGGNILPLPVPESEMASLDRPGSAESDALLPHRGDPGPSEPTSLETTEDLVHPPGAAAAGGEGVLERMEHAAEDAAANIKEGLMEALDPGREMVGDVYQETESGKKVALTGGESGGGAVQRAVPAVGGESSGSDEPAVQHSGAGGYASDSDVPGPVLEGVHPKGI